MITLDLPVALHGAFVIGLVTGGFAVAAFIAAVLAWRRPRP